MLKLLWSAKTSILTWIRSFFNGNQFLNPISDKYPVVLKRVSSPSLRNHGPSNPNASDQSPRENPNLQKSYALIYGCHNKAGKAYAYYLMSKGFNLILIERDGDSMQALEE